MCPTCVQGKVRRAMGGTGARPISRLVGPVAQRCGACRIVQEQGMRTVPDADLVLPVLWPCACSVLLLSADILYTPLPCCRYPKVSPVPRVNVNTGNNNPGSYLSGGFSSLFPVCGTWPNQLPQISTDVVRPRELRDWVVHSPPERSPD